MQSMGYSVKISRKIPRVYRSFDEQINRNGSRENRSQSSVPFSNLMECNRLHIMSKLRFFPKFIGHFLRKYSIWVSGKCFFIMLCSFFDSDEMQSIGYDVKIKIFLKFLDDFVRKWPKWVSGKCFFMLGSFF